MSIHHSGRLPRAVSTFCVAALKEGLALNWSWMMRLKLNKVPYTGEGEYGCASGKGSA